MPDIVRALARFSCDEMLGNLLDNACKWGRSRIAIASATSGSTVVITVDDDGPGLEASMRAGPASIAGLSARPR
jgi:C4-dicarboxylate-specific signal transduction histidine kinase